MVLCFAKSWQHVRVFSLGMSLYFVVCATSCQLIDKPSSFFIYFKKCFCQAMLYHILISENVKLKAFFFKYLRFIQQNIREYFGNYALLSKQASKAQASKKPQSTAAKVVFKNYFFTKSSLFQTQLFLIFFTLSLLLLRFPFVPAFSEKFNFMAQI